MGGEGSADRSVDQVPNPPASVEQAARDARQAAGTPDTAPVLPPTLGQATPGGAPNGAASGLGRPGVTPPPPGGPGGVGGGSRPAARRLPGDRRTPEFRSWWTVGGAVRAGFVLRRA